MIIVGGAALIFTPGRILYRRFKTPGRTRRRAARSCAAARLPVQVVGVEAVSYAARMGVNATFMHAFHIPVSVTNVFLIVAASSISSTVAILPGAVGVQTGLASVVLQRRRVPVGHHGVHGRPVRDHHRLGRRLRPRPLAQQIGWDETKKLLHRRRKKDEAKDAAWRSTTGANPARE